MPISFPVHRRQTILVRPAEPTPTETKPLSDIDDQDLLRTHISFVFLYPHRPPMAGQNPADVIRRALARAIVHFYPLAGRLREGPRRKLYVECTGGGGGPDNGVIYTVADAEIRLDQLGPAPSPPFPCMDELLYISPEWEGVVGTPLVVVQLTRLACMGFVLAVRVNHVMADAKGVAMFLTAVGEIARGAPAPAVLPVWRRELLSSRNPPRVTRVHHGYNDVVPIVGDNDEYGSGAAHAMEEDENLHHSFFFGAKEVAAVRRHLGTASCSTFDAIAAGIWKCWGSAWDFDASDKVRLHFAVDARRKLGQITLGDGYYGNVIVVPAAVATAGELRLSPGSRAVELVRGVKGTVDEEYVRSLADLMEVEGRPAMELDRAYCISDLTRAGLDKVDFGWGEPVYAGPTMGGSFGFMSWTYHVRVRTEKGEEGVLVPLCFPRRVMDRFKVELHNMITSGANGIVDNS